LKTFFLFLLFIPLPLGLGTPIFPFLKKKNTRRSQALEVELDEPPASAFWYSQATP